MHYVQMVICFFVITALHEGGHAFFIHLFKCKLTFFIVGRGFRLFGWTKGFTCFEFRFLPFGGRVWYQIAPDMPLSNRIWISIGGPLAHAVVVVIMAFVMPRESLYYIGDHLVLLILTMILEPSHFEVPHVSNVFVLFFLLNGVACIENLIPFPRTDGFKIIKNSFLLLRNKWKAGF